MNEELEEGLFEAPKREYTVNELDDMVRFLDECEKIKDEKKEIYSKAELDYKKAKDVLLKALEESGKKKYHVEGMGTVSVVTKMKVTVPKDLSSKEALFNWIEKNLGHEASLNYTTVNYQTLNSLYNNEYERAVMEERADDFHIDGVSMPIAEQSLSFRRK